MLNITSLCDGYLGVCNIVLYSLYVCLKYPVIITKLKGKGRLGDGIPFPCPDNHGAPVLPQGRVCGTIGRTSCCKWAVFCMSSISNHYGIVLFLWKHDFWVSNDILLCHDKLRIVYYYNFFLVYMASSFMEKETVTGRAAATAGSEERHRGLSRNYDPFNLLMMVLSY